MLLLAAIAAALAAPAARVTDVTSPIEVDGALDEPAWEQAEPVTDLVRFRPTRGGPPPGRTEVRFLQDDRALYVGVRVTGASYPVRARVSAREAINSDDQIGVYLDTFDDDRSGYIFYLNPLGIQQDIRHDAGSWNAEWDTVFRSRGQVTEDGYELEIALPWRSIKYPATAGPQTWGIIVTRKIPDEGAKYAFPLLDRAHPRLFAQAAALEGVRPAPRGSGLEIVPGLTAIQQGARADDGTTSWTGFDPWHEAVRPSVDLRLGLTPNLGLTGTVNPDFSQVENDETPIDLNARFAFWFPERRPFFLEGADHFADRPGTLYTRSIVDPIYGMKLGGREGPLTVGVLHALDRSPGASVNEAATPGFDDKAVDGALATNTFVRIRADAFGQGHAGITLADKRIVGPDGERGVHDALAVDLSVPIGEAWTLAGSALQSWTGVPGSALAWGQESGVSLSRSTARGPLLSTWFTDRTADLRKETGFLTQSARTDGGGNLGWAFEPPGIVDTWTPFLSFGAIEERDGDRNRWAEHSVSLGVGGRHAMGAYLGLSDIVEQGVGVRGGWAGGWWNGDLGRVLELSSSVTAARTVDYSLLVPARSQVMSVGAALRPTTGLRVDTTLRHQRLAPEGHDLQTASLVRTRLAWQFSREWGLRLIGEHTSGRARDPGLTTSALVSWLLHPGTAAWLGYAETRPLTAGAAATDRTVFAKATLLVRR